MKESPISIRFAKHKGVLFAILLSFLTGGVLQFMSVVNGLQIQNRTVKISDSQAGAITRYSFSLQTQTTAPIGSIRFQICANDPLIGQPCTPPAGFSASGAILDVQTGVNGFVISGSSTANEIILTRLPSPAVANTALLYDFSNILNPSSAGSYFVRAETFSSTDATGPNIDFGGLAFVINSALSINATVPPYLLFCLANSIIGQDCNTASGNYIDFGDFSSTKTAFGQSESVVATNAEYGFTIAVQGTTMTSGINVINQLSSPDISRKGVSQFGLNLRANSTPATGTEPQGLGLSAVVSPRYNQPNYFTFSSGDVLVSATDPDMQKYTITYIANVSKGQAAGIYVSTLTYIAVATF